MNSTKHNRRLMRTASALLALVLAACGGSEEPAGSGNGPPLNSNTLRDGFLYEVTLDISPGAPQVLLGEVTITNTATVPRTLAFHDSCIATLRAYSGVDLTWDQRDFVLCSGIWEDFTLLPGMQQSFPLDFTVSNLLTSSLSPGLYTITVYLQPYPEHTQVRAQVELYTGDFDLRG